MLAKDVLAQLDLGNSVAEFDTSLEHYFVETNTFRLLVRGEIDVVAGDKGTGKTALFRILAQRYTSIPELDKVEVFPAFNPTGSPVFQRLAEGEVLTEGQYIGIWKAYNIALVGNWLLGVLGEEYETASQRELDVMLRHLDLRSADDSPTTVFSKLINLMKRLGNAKSVSTAVSFDPNGMPVVVPTVELGDGGAVDELTGVVTHDEAFSLLNRLLEDLDFNVWLVFDRLDEAFQGFPEAEIPALRALLRTYLDMSAYPRVRMKLFVRRDLFRRIIGGGFVNLTHVNARKVEITWSNVDLWDLLCKRFRENPTFLDSLGLSADTDCEGIFNSVFPEQVDSGGRKPKTWTWMMRRIRDGNDVQPPRNLIDLIKKTQQAQLRTEEREESEFVKAQAIIRSEAIKQGLSALSVERVEDTLLAEAGELSTYIEEFRGGKAEHNLASLTATLGVPDSEVAAIVKSLTGLGFLEKLGESYKIPSLYRDGLNVTQGKAFASTSDADEEDLD